MPPIHNTRVAHTFRRFLPECMCPSPRGGGAPSAWVVLNVGRGNQPMLVIPTLP